MPILKDEEGNEIEAVPVEEVEEKISQATEEIKSQYEEEIENLKGEIATKEEEMKKLSNKDLNFKKLRDTKKLLEEQLKEKEAEWDKKIDEKISPLTQKLQESKLEKEVVKYTSDPKVSEKIKYYFGQFKGDPKDEKEFQERVKNASILAMGSVSPQSSDAFSSTGGEPGISAPQKARKISPKAKEFGKKFFHLTDEDFNNQ